MKPAVFKRKPVAIPDDATNGGYVRQLREEFGLTQIQVADAIGISDAKLSELERGVAGFDEITFEAAVSAINKLKPKLKHYGPRTKT